MRAQDALRERVDGADGGGVEVPQGRGERLLVGRGVVRCLEALRHPLAHAVSQFGAGPVCEGDRRDRGDGHRRRPGDGVEDPGHERRRLARAGAGFDERVVAQELGRSIACALVWKFRDGTHDTSSSSSSVGTLPLTITARRPSRLHTGQ